MGKVALSNKPIAHVVDVLGNVIGRDQPILRMSKAIEMVSLLSEETFLDENVVFFDPFCKAGELLLSCAYMSCAAKIKSNPKLMDVDKINKEIFESKRYFALAPDERHHRLSLRTFLGNTNSHDEQYNHVIRNGNYLSETDGRLDKEIFKREFEAMIEYIKRESGNKKIIAVGNPPYQEADGGYGRSAKSIYDYFTDALIKSNEISEFVLVIPARWFGGGKGLNRFRESVRMSKKIKNLRYFKKANEVFPTVDINGGICYFQYTKSHNGITKFSDGKNEIGIDLSKYDIIVDDPRGYSLVSKILNKWKGKFVSDIAWSEKPFGLRTNYFILNESLAESEINSVPCLSRYKRIQYVEPGKITKNNEHIDSYKVSVPAIAGGSKGSRRSTIPKNQIFLIDKGMISTETI